MTVVLLFILIAGMRAVQAVCGKRASNEVQSNQTFFLYGTYYQILAALFSLITLSFTGFQGFTIGAFWCGLVTAAFLMLNFYANLNAVKGCKLIVTQLLNNGGMLICCFVSWVWFQEAMSVLQGVGLLLFFIAAYLLSSSKTNGAEEEERKKISKLTWIFLIVMMFAEGGVEISQKYFSLRLKNGSVAWYSFFMFAFSSLIMGSGLFIIRIGDGQKKRLSLTESGVQTAPLRLNRALLICGVLLALAVFFVNLSVTKLGKTVSSVVLFPVSAAITICITVLVGRIVYKEKLTVKNLVGVALGLLAIIVLAIFTPETTAKIFG
ncbi:MAG: hypothetical protein IIX01_00365 [Clostridia bacterium]|nr:hypothetical protein [Clostridia bacterium]